MNPILLRDAKTVSFLRQIGISDLNRLQYFAGKVVDQKTKEQIMELQKESLFLIELAAEIEFMQKGMDIKHD